MEVIKNIFEDLGNGRSIYKYKLINDNNAYVSIINYGGIITEICVPDKYGNLENVVIGLAELLRYKNNNCYFGAAVGRTAGRISNASFKIDGTLFNLDKNDGSNNLHGGFNGLSRVIWNTKEIKGGNYVGLELDYFSPDMENGFPGNMNIKITYTFSNNNELNISYQAHTDKKTIINMTNHSYFNLSGGCKEDILTHYLSINSDKIFELDENLIPTGKLLPVKDTPFDFTKPKMVGKDINKDNQQLKNGHGYDHPFILNKDKNIPITLFHEKSGRLLEIKTDAKCLVFYSGNSISDNFILDNGKKSSDRSALCLETQYYPDAVNQKIIPSNILNPGEIYNANTTYCFKVK